MTKIKKFPYIHDVKIAKLGDYGLKIVDPSNLVDPTDIPFLAIDVPKSKFRFDAQFEFRNDCEKSLWIGGMGAYSGECVRLVLDTRCPEDIFVFYNYLEDAEHQRFLGKLKPGEFFDITMKKFKSFRL